MKRFASHYLYLPNHGFLKQYAVEIEGDKVVRIAPCHKEEAYTEWLPGILMLHTTESWETVKIHTNLLNEVPIQFTENKLDEISWKLSHLYPYNFTSLMPSDETRHRQLL